MTRKLGRPQRRAMKIKDFASYGVIELPPSATIGSAASCLFENEVGAVVIEGATGEQGMFTETDLVRAVSDGVEATETPVEDYMTDSVVIVDEEDELQEAIVKMNDLHLRHLAVSRDGKIVGVISSRDLLAALSRGLN